MLGHSLQLAIRDDHETEVDFEHVIQSFGECFKIIPPFMQSLIGCSLLVQVKQNALIHKLQQVKLSFHPWIQPSVHFHTLLSFIELETG